MTLSPANAGALPKAVAIRDHRNAGDIFPYGKVIYFPREM